MGAELSCGEGGCCGDPNKKEAQMIKHIVPEGVECIFVRQPEQLGLGHAVLCAARAVGNEPFVVLLADKTHH